MFAIYCNNCFQDNQQNSSLEFYLSSCEHIFCKDCINPVCNVCKRPYKPILICKNMSLEMSNLFQDNRKLFRNFQKVTKFQMTQMAHIANYSVNTMPGEKKKLLKQKKGLVRLGGEIADKLKAENQRIEKLKDYLAYHERRLEQMPMSASQRPPILGRRRLTSMGSSSQAARVQTPTLSIPDSNTDGSNNTGNGASILYSKFNPN